MALVRFTLYDPFTLETFVFFRNPEDDAEPGEELPFTIQPTPAPDGTTYLFAGAPKIREFTWTFKIFSKAERDTWRSWVGTRKPYQVQMTNDLGDTYWIMIDRWQVKRKRSAKQEINLDVTVHAYEVPAA